MDITVLMPILGVLVGGALSIFGNYSNQMIAHKKLVESQKVNRTIEKLELLGQYANEMRSKAITEQGRVFQLLLNTAMKKEHDDVSGEPKNEEFLLLIRLYQPSLLEVGMFFESSCRKVRDINFKKLSDVAVRKKSLETNDQYYKRNTVAVDEMKAAYEEFMNKLGDSFSKYRD